MTAPDTSKKKSVKPIPEGRPRVSPYLVAKDAGKVIDFLRRVVDAKETYRMADPAGKVMHAEVEIGNSNVMIADATDKHPAMPGMLHIYVDDVDAAYAKAIAAGAIGVQPPADQFYGDRSGGVKDASGNSFWLSSHVEDVSVEEIARRAAAQGK